MALAPPQIAASVLTADYRSLAAIKDAGAQAGVALNPATPLSAMVMAGAETTVVGSGRYRHAGGVAEAIEELNALRPPRRVPCPAGE